MYFDYQSQEIHQMSSKTKCQYFKCRFSEVDDWSPIIAKPIVSRPMITIFSEEASSSNNFINSAISTVSIFQESISPLILRDQRCWLP